jgi:Fic family protein
LLQEVREQGAWEEWLEFFLNAVYETAQQAAATIKQINALFEHDAALIAALGQKEKSTALVFEYLKKLPQVEVVPLAQALALSAPTVRSVLNGLVKLEILEVNRAQRNKVYVYKKYLDLLAAGTEPL